MYDIVTLRTQNNEPMIKNLLRNGLVASICLAVASTTIKAEERQSAIVVWNGDSELYSFFVSDSPMLKVSNGNAIIKSDGTWEYEANLEKVTNTCYYSIPMSESSKYKLTLEERDYTGLFNHGNATAIDEVISITSHPAFSLRDGILQVAGLGEGEQVTVASTDGKVIVQAKASHAGHTSISLHGQAGTLVVKAGGASFKVLVK